MKAIQIMSLQMQEFIKELPVERWEVLAKKPLPTYNSVSTFRRWAPHHTLKLVDRLLWGSMTKTFCIPNEEVNEALEIKAWEKFRANNASLTHPTQRVYDAEVLAKVRRNVRSIFKSIHYDLADAWWGPKSNLSTKDDVSYLFKERCRVTVYPGTEKLVASLLLRQRAQYEKYFKWAQSYLGQAPTQQELFWFTVGTFRRVRGAKFTSVFKSNTQRRGIAIEASGNTLIQRVASGAARLALRKNLGIDLDTLADVHRDRICGPVATIDFSSASDSIHKDDLSFFGFPRWYRDLCFAGRAPFTCFRGESVYNRVLSSMGNTATFETMTVLLTAIARVFDPNATVFGDDVIIADEQAESFIKAITSLTNFKVNTEKSFWGGDHVRESCGAYYVRGYGYVTSYKANAVTKLSSAVALANKVLLTARATHDSELREKALKLHVELVRTLRAHLKDGPEVSFLPEYLMSTTWVNEKLNRNGRRVEMFLQLEVFNASVIQSTNATRVTIQEAKHDDFIPLDLAIRFLRNPTRETRGAEHETIVSGTFCRASGRRLA